MEELISEIKTIGFDEISRQIQEKLKVKQELEQEVNNLTNEFKVLKFEEEENFNTLVKIKGEAQFLRVFDHV
jgi:hypothetical protein